MQPTVPGSGPSGVNRALCARLAVLSRAPPCGRDPGGMRGMSSVGMACPAWESCPLLLLVAPA